MKKNKKKNKSMLSKTGLALGIGFTVFSVISQGYAIYKERQGDLSVTFPEAENEIKQTVNAVRQQREAKTDE